MADHPANVRPLFREVGERIQALTADAKASADASRAAAEASRSVSGEVTTALTGLTREVAGLREDLKRPTTDPLMEAMMGLAEGLGITPKSSTGGAGGTS